MGYKVNLIKISNSVALILPKPIVDMLNMQEKDSFDLTYDYENSSIVLKREDNKKETGQNAKNQN